MPDSIRVSVLIPKAVAEHFDAYCRDRGFKKSPLIARLIRDHLRAEGFTQQHELFHTERDQARGEQR